jgi:hypothetical protein
MGDDVRGGVFESVVDGTVGVGGTNASSGADCAMVMKGVEDTTSV